MPASTWSTIRAPSRVELDDEPFSAITIDRGRDAALARQPRVRGQHPELAVDGHDRLRPEQREHRAQLLGVPWPETCTGAFSSCSTSAPRFARWLIASWTRSSLPGIGFAEMITVSPRSTVHGRMVVVGDPRQRRHRLALAAGAEDEHLVRRELVEVASGGRACRPGTSM